MTMMLTMPMMLDYNSKLFCRVLLFANTSKSICTVNLCTALICGVATAIILDISTCGLERISKHIFPVTRHTAHSIIVLQYDEIAFKFSPNSPEKWQ